MSCYAPPQVPSQPGRSLAPVYNLLLAFGWCPLDGDHHSSGAAITADLSREMLGQHQRGSLNWSSSRLFWLVGGFRRCESSLRALLSEKRRTRDLASTAAFAQLSTGRVRQGRVLPLWPSGGRRILLRQHDA